MGENSMVDLKNYLSTPERPVAMAEFKEFWDSCSDEEKEEFRNTPGIKPDTTGMVDPKKE